MTAACSAVGVVLVVAGRMGHAVVDACSAVWVVIVVVGRMECAVVAACFAVGVLLVAAEHRMVADGAQLVVVGGTCPVVVDDCFGAGVRSGGFAVAVLLVP